MSSCVTLLLFEDRVPLNLNSQTGQGGLPVSSEDLSICLHFPTSPMQVRDGYGYIYQAFNVGTRDPNTDPYACEASTLFTEPSSQVLVP